MRSHAFLIGIIGMTLVLAGTTARACLICETSTGQKVRAGIWNEHFWDNVLLTASPFAFFALIVVLLHFGVPFICQAKHVVVMDTCLGTHTTDFKEILPAPEKIASA